MVIVEWKKDCLKIIPTFGKGAKKPSIRLFPKMNVFEDSQWDLAKVHVADSIARGDIVVSVPVEKAKEGAKPKAVKTINELSVKKALALVAKTENPDSLLGFIDIEKRSEVRLAILRQMKELKIEAPENTVGDLKEDQVEG